MSSFDGASLNDLRAMIASADPSGLDTVASKWSAVHEALRQAQEDLLRHTLAATTHWQGAAADAFSARADELHQSLGNGAAYAFNASSGVSCAAEALRAAQAAMPAGALSIEGIAAAQQATAAGVTATQFEDRQRQQAAAVMRRLEEGYAAAGEMIGNPSNIDRSEDRGAILPRGGSGINSISTKTHTLRKVESSAGSGNSLTQGGHVTNQPDNREPKPAADLCTTRTIDTETPASKKTNSTIGSQPLGTLNDTQASNISNTPLASHPRKHLATNGTQGDFALADGAAKIPSNVNRFREEAPSGMPLRSTASKPEVDPFINSRQSPPLHHSDASPHHFEKSPEIVGGIQAGSRDLLRATPATTGERSQITKPSIAAPAGGAALMDSRSRKSAKVRQRPKYLIEDRQFWLPEQSANPPVIT